MITASHVNARRIATCTKLWLSEESNNNPSQPIILSGVIGGIIGGCIVIVIILIIRCYDYNKQSRQTKPLNSIDIEENRPIESRIVNISNNHSNNHSENNLSVPNLPSDITKTIQE